MVRFSRRDALLLCSLIFADPVIAAQIDCDQAGLEFQLKNPTLRKSSIANIIACSRAPIAQQSKFLILDGISDPSLQRPELIRAVGEWVGGSDWTVQSATLNRLSEIGHAAEPALPHLQRKLEGDARDNARAVTALAIGGTRDWSLDALRAQLGSAAIQRKWLLGIAGARAGLRDPIVIDGLLEALGRDTGAQAVQAARYLKPLPSSVRTRLIEGTSGHDDWIAAFSVKGLSEAGELDASFVPLLRKMVLEDYYWVEPLDAWRAFGLSPADASAVLKARTARDFQIDPIVRIGTAAIPALLTMSAGDDPNLRAFAAACLIRIPNVKESVRKRALAILAGPQPCPPMVRSCLDFKGAAGHYRGMNDDLESSYDSMTAEFPKLPADLGIRKSTGDISLTLSAPARIFKSTDAITLRVKFTNTSGQELLILNPGCSPIVPIAAKLIIFKEPGWPMTRVNHTMFHLGLAGNPPPPEHYSTRLQPGRSRTYDCELQTTSPFHGWSFDYHRTGENPPDNYRLTSGVYRIRVHYRLDQEELNSLMSSNTLWGFKGSPWMGEAISDEVVVKIR